MPAFTSTSSLFDVMSNPSAREIISSEIPELANNPLIHTLHRYPLGLILSTEERLSTDGGCVSRY